MIKLEFSSEISEIVSGLTRVKLDKKLTIPDSIEYVFNKQYSFFKNEKVNKITALSFFMIQCACPLVFYFIYIHCGDILQNSFGYSAAQVIHHNLIISSVHLISMFVITYLSYKIHPLKILKVFLFVATILFLICPYLLNNITSPFQLLLLQLLMVAFALGEFPATPIFYKHFPVFKRFTYSCFMYALGRGVTFVITSFGLIYLVKYLGNCGILCIAIPMLVGYKFALSHFEKLEKNKIIQY